MPMRAVRYDKVSASDVGKVYLTQMRMLGYGSMNTIVLFLQSALKSLKYRLTMDVLGVVDSKKT